jgi:cbb3-type cytochrome oxidase subunit 1
MNARWPAIAFQGVFLAANISFLLAGEHNIFILASVNIIMLLFAFQTLGGNPRFMYLFPVDRSSGMPIPTPSLDTWILRVLIVLSILSFYVGATGSYYWSSVLVALGILSPLVWRKWLYKYNRKFIHRKLTKPRSQEDSHESDA